MSDEDFLSRWSRRKRAAEEPSKVNEHPGAEKAPAAAEAVPEEAFDLSTLPPIDSITSLTDVSVFLRKGVPLELSRAALRRAWTSDPGIRDFVGLAENAWDFNDPNAMAGFGPLDHSPEQVREMVRQAFGEIDRAVSTTPPSEPELAREADRSEDIGEQAADVSESEPAIASGNVASIGDLKIDETVEQADDSSAGDSSVGAQAAPVQIVHRTHGGAIPR